jgi:hypothetical protein
MARGAALTVARGASTWFVRVYLGRDPQTVERSTWPPPANLSLGRVCSPTFAGIRPADTSGFVVVQLACAFAATLLFRWLTLGLEREAPDVLIGHQDGRLRPILAPFAYIL